MPEENALICKPISSPGYVVPGSLPGKCSQCGKSVWIAPSSWLLLHDNPGMVILCKACGFASMEKHGGIIEAPSPAQREEIQEYTRGRR